MGVKCFLMTFALLLISSGFLCLPIHAWDGPQILKMTLAKTGARTCHENERCAYIEYDQNDDRIKGFNYTDCECPDDLECTYDSDLAHPKTFYSCELVPWCNEYLNKLLENNNFAFIYRCMNSSKSIQYETSTQNETSIQNGTLVAGLPDQFEVTPLQKRAVYLQEEASYLPNETPKVKNVADYWVKEKRTLTMKYFGSRGERSPTMRKLTSKITG